MSKAIDLWAAMPAVVAYDQRRRRGQELVEPRDDLGYSANFPSKSRNSSLSTSAGTTAARDGPADPLKARALSSQVLNAPMSGSTCGCRGFHGSRCESMVKESRIGV